ncbi:hypothetical protein C8J57DRAFT_1297902 [Mycena rebaudengoi]|nr:hypothetical protein C8J57DRAFT_1297902 [Mycena rebaudengoi]
MRRTSAYHSDSPSPVDLHASASLPHPFSAPHSQDRFAYGPISVYPAGTAISDRQPRYGLLPKISTSNILDQRRMSEPAVPYMSQPGPNSGAQNRSQQYNFNNYISSPHSPESPFAPSVSRVASLGSLRDPRHGYSSSLPHAEWKQDADPSMGEISPLQASFGGGVSGSPLQYPTRGEDSYGPSPPGTGTSSSSVALPALQSSPPGGGGSSDPSNKKTYSFVALPGNTVRKRPRRRYDEIERLYHCSWPDCNKAYGTLNHLNAHVQMQKHGAKRSPNEFKELRKQWRKAKKEYESPGLDDHVYHTHPYSSPHRSFSHNSALSPQLSVAVPQLRQDGSYIIDNLRYSPDNRDMDPHAYGGLDFRQQNTPTSWHGPASAPSARSDLYQSPLSAHPPYPYLDNRSQILENAHLRSTPSGQVAERYADNYYDDDARGRPSSNLDQGSGDEY